MAKQPEKKPSMTKDELNRIRITLGLKPGEMATALETKRRTYQDWQSGRNPIPGVVRVACQGLLDKDRYQMHTIAPGYVPKRLREATKEGQDAAMQTRE